MRVLFLDIDGVLNSERTKLAMNGYPHSFSVEDQVKFDWIAVAMIRKLVAWCGAYVVWSTSWRYENRSDIMGEVFDLPVCGATPTDSYFATRGAEIAGWLAKHPEVTHYAIVDDIQAFTDEQQAHLVLTDDKLGLTVDNYYALRDILMPSDKPLQETK
jgi:hypothetical protein